MHYLIDGYNFVFYFIDPKKSLQSQRQSVIRGLQEEFAQLGLEGMIVFDGSQVRGGESGLSYQSPLIIAYSFSGETADRYILDKVESAKRPSELTVVSNDKSLTAAARKHGANTLDLKAFLAFLAKKRKKISEKPEPRAFVESEAETERLIKLFEERLKNEDEQE